MSVTENILVCCKNIISKKNKPDTSHRVYWLELFCVAIDILIWFIWNWTHVSDTFHTKKNSMKNLIGTCQIVSEKWILKEKQVE